MQLSDHIRTLLRDHDCVIIPDFGGLIADYAPAQVHPVRHTLTPPTKHVAFNQSLTRNDGLLVDALSRALQVSRAEARELVHKAVANLRQDLAAKQRAELSGIGIFRQAPGRGLDFEYTGYQNLLSASYGLPELVSRPVRATDALLARERSTAAPLLAAHNRRTRRFWQTAAATTIIGLALLANYLFALHWNYLPAAWRPQPAAVAAASTSPTAVVVPKPKPVTRQQAALARTSDDWTTEPVAAATPTTPETPAVETPVTTAPTAAPAAKPAAAKTPAASKPVAAKPTATAAPVAAKSTAPSKVATPAATAPAAAPATAGTINSRTGRFYAIAGSFNTLAKAEQSAKILQKKHGQQIRVVHQPNSRWYRLSVADYPDNLTINQHLPQLYKQYGNVWILPY